MFDVLEHISVIKSNAVGSGALDPLFLKALTKLLIYYTNLSVLNFSEYWKLAKILPIPEGNNQFRPDETLTIWRQLIYSWSVEMHERSRWCTTALINVVEDLRSKLDGNIVAFLVLLDHTKAFIIVDHEVLLN